LSAQQEAPLDAEQLVRGMVDNELESGRQHQSHWMYQLQRQEGDKTTVKEIIETKDCEIDSLLSLNGEALTPDQRQKENERLGKLVNDPAEQLKKKHGQEEDDHMAIEVFKMLPEAFSYRCGAAGDPWSNLILHRTQTSVPLREKLKSSMPWTARCGSILIRNDWSSLMAV
jgi:hypothetical protein